MRDGWESDADDSDGEEAMLLEHKSLIEANVADLITMDPEKMVTQLVRRGILIREDCELISSQFTTREKNEKIIRVLKQRGPKAFDTFFQSLNSIDERHITLSEKLQPVRYRILWFTSCPRDAAAVAYGLETYDGSILTNAGGRKSQHSYILRRGRIFKKDLGSKTERERDMDLVPLARDVELYLAFPISERGDTPRKALMDVFAQLGTRVDMAVMSGTCVGVRGDSVTELGVRGGEVVIATEAVRADGHRLELPLSQALMDAKTHLSQLSEDPPKWLEEAKERLTKISNREHPTLLPHLDTIRQDQQPQVTPTVTRLPRALATDVYTYPFYELCTRHLGVERPWFSCKSAISYEMLNNIDPSMETNCSVVSGLFAIEACKFIVERLRQSQR